MPRGARGTILTAALVALAGCSASDETPRTDGSAAGDPQAAPAAQPAPPPQPAAPPPLRLEVDVAARELRVYRDDRLESTHPVAVGTSEWPTRTGEWTVGQVVWNPRWTPPTDESWAEDEEAKEPGDPENPLGRAQLVYDAPRSIHGTNEPQSLGKAASHGSIRAANDVVLRLARMAAEAGGAAKDEAWYRQAETNRRERYELALPNPIPIRVIEGGGPSAGGGARDGAPDDSAGRGGSR
jgi:hypothetical protein